MGRLGIAMAVLGGLSARFKNIIHFGLVLPVMIYTVIYNWPPSTPREVFIVVTAVVAGTVVLLMPFLESRSGDSSGSPD
jgi:hypothetical protein